jgi:DNA repair protein RecN (Recombination protein N)
MLQKLFIQNYVLIDSVTIEPNAHLNIVTGEIGAGKSILKGALNLILGERVDSNVLINPDNKCVLEGSFITENNAAVSNFLKENDLDIDTILLLRREIAPNGKSRAFINDTPVSLQQLKALGYLLVDLHQQFDTLDLAEADFQRQMIDALAQSNDTLKQYQSIYKSWQSNSQQLQQLQNQKEQFEIEADYNRFLLEELTALQLIPNELENLDELNLLSNSEDITAALKGVVELLTESEQPIIHQLKQMMQQLQAYQNLHTDLPSIIERLTAAHIELKDIANEVNRLNDHISFDVNRTAEIEERLAAGYKLLKKYNVSNTNALSELQEQLSHRLNEVLAIDDNIIALQQKVHAQKNEVIALAEKISAPRKKAIPPFQQ